MRRILEKIDEATVGLITGPAQVSWPGCLVFFPARTLARRSMTTRSRSRPPTLNPFPVSAIERTLLAAFRDEEQPEHVFLVKAKRAWRQAHPSNIPTRGRPSVEDQCFSALVEGLMEAGFVSLILHQRSSEIEVVPQWVQLPLGRLVQMIRAYAPEIQLSTARKYARIWVQNYYPRTVTPTQRLAHYRRIRQRHPDLYTDLYTKKNPS
jgi:hypothetical protein